MEARVEAKHQRSRGDIGEEFVTAEQGVQIVFLMLNEQETQGIDNNRPGGYASNDIKLGNEEKDEVKHAQNQIADICRLAGFVDRSVVMFLISFD
jgi:hypothetical protein